MTDGPSPARAEAGRPAPGSILRAGAWWHRRDDGTWLRWDEDLRRWTPHPTPPPPDPVPPHRPLSTPRGWTVWLLGIVVAVNVAAVISDVAELALIQQVVRGEEITLREGLANDTRQAWFAVAQALAVLPAGSAFLVWFHRAYRNLRALGATNPRFGTGWAIGVWFVPILNLWRTKQIANDIWRASDPQAPVEQEGGWRGGAVSPFLGWWWGLWVGGGLIGLVVLWQDPATLEGIQAISLVVTLVDVLAVGAAILAIQVVRTLTDRQEARARLVFAPPAPA